MKKIHRQIIARQARVVEKMAERIRNAKLDSRSMNKGLNVSQEDFELDRYNGLIQDGINNIQFMNIPGWIKGLSATKKAHIFREYKEHEAKNQTFEHPKFRASLTGNMYAEKKFLFRMSPMNNMKTQWQITSLEKRRRVTSFDHQ